MSDNYFRWGRKKIANKNQNSIEFSVSGIQMDLRDVSYYVKRKQGFPSITDLGVANIFLGGSGLSFKMKLSTADKSDRQNFFQVDKVSVSSRPIYFFRFPWRLAHIQNICPPNVLGISGRLKFENNADRSFRLMSRTSILSSQSLSTRFCSLLPSQSS
jgi:hypothetical protein